MPHTSRRATDEQRRSRITRAQARRFRARPAGRRRRTTGRDPVGAVVVRWREPGRLRAARRVERRCAPRRWVPRAGWRRSRSAPRAGLRPARVVRRGWSAPGRVPRRWRRGWCAPRGVPEQRWRRRPRRVSVPRSGRTVRWLAWRLRPARRGCTWRCATSGRVPVPPRGRPASRGRLPAARRRRSASRRRVSRSGRRRGSAAIVVGRGASGRRTSRSEPRSRAAVGRRRPALGRGVARFR